MGDVINLRATRKAQTRNAAQRQAESNRALHGRTTAEKMRDRDEAARLARNVDGARIDGDRTD